MCKLDKSLIQGPKVILFSIENALQENHGHGWSSAPYGQSGSISRRWAASKPDSWKDDARAARSLSSLPSCNSRALLNSARSNARKADLEAGPLDSLNETNHRRGSKTVPKPQRSHEVNDCEESFPGDVTRQRSKPAEFPEQRRSWTRDARNKELNSRGKTKQLQTCFKPIQASTNWIPNPDWTG